MKKTMMILAVTAMMTFAPLTAGAQSALCPLENCSRTGEHWHDGTYYEGHYAGDGHDHQVCGVQGCTKTGSHRHNGKTCLPHNEGDGHGYHGGGRHGKSGHRGRHH